MSDLEKILDLIDRGDGSENEPLRDVGKQPSIEEFEQMIADASDGDQWK